MDCRTGSRTGSREDSAAASSATAVGNCTINGTHAVQLARHLAELYKRRRFTDLKVRSPWPSERFVDAAATFHEWS